MKEFKSCFIDIIINHYFDFSGKATRKQFWIFLFFSVIIPIIIKFINENLAGIIGLLLIMPQLAITFRRLHDTNHSPWWLLCPLITMIYGYLPDIPSNYYMHPDVQPFLFLGALLGLGIFIGNIRVLVFLCSASKK